MRSNVYQPKDREAALLVLISRARLAGQTPRRAVLAETLGVSVPTIGMDLRALRAAGYVDPDDRRNHITLTPLGQSYAVQRRHAATALTPVNTKSTKSPKAGATW